MSKFFSFFFVLFFAFVFVSCGDMNVDLGGGGDDSTPTPPPVGEEEGEEEVEEGYVLGDFEIGDVGPAGGLIFYIDEAEEFEWTFLEAAPEDLESVVWAAEYSVTGVIDQDIGSGSDNTLNIISVLGEGNYAAKRCADHVVGEFNDFFLPSKDELNAMYVNLHEQDLGGFANYVYWSSSEGNGSNAWSQYFVDGRQDSYGKDTNYHVRCARAF
ncbi:MAG TPA: hypothetical protein PK443_01305 [bacterium]|nr:hypothetical protein [bacterium]